MTLSNRNNKQESGAYAIYAVVVLHGVIIGKSKSPRKAAKRHFDKMGYNKMTGLKEVVVWFSRKEDAERVHSDAMAIMGKLQVKRSGDNQSPLMDVPLKSAKMFIEQASVKSGISPLREYDVFRHRGFKRQRKAADLSQYKGIE